MEWNEREYEALQVLQPQKTQKNQGEGYKNVDKQ